jgi:hypothetical protein
MNIERTRKNALVVSVQIADAQPVLFQRGRDMRTCNETHVRMIVQSATQIVADHPGAIDGDARTIFHAMAAAAARPATRPENRQPPRKLPSSAR